MQCNNSSLKHTTNNATTNQPSHAHVIAHDLSYARKKSSHPLPHNNNDTFYQNTSANNGVTPQVINNNNNNNNCANPCQNNNCAVVQHIKNLLTCATNNAIINQLPNTLALAASSTSSTTTCEISNELSKSKWAKGNKLMFYQLRVLISKK